jgi:urease accessory protein
MTRSEAGALFAALQLGDSALPIGRFAHSYGLEALLADDPELGEKDVAELVESALCQGAPRLDGVAVATAHRATTVEELLSLDRWLTARKPSPGARQASTACGRALAALVPAFTGAEPASAHAAAVARGETDGNLAVVEGALARALGIPLEVTVLIELRGYAAGLLSAAVRLGRLSSLRAQALQRRLAPALLAGAAESLQLDPAEASSSAIELELASLAHERRDARLFAT